MPKKKRGKGLGDVVSRTIKTVTNGTLKECGGCEKRKALLNTLFPFNRNA